MTLIQRASRFSGVIVVAGFCGIGTPGALGQLTFTKIIGEGDPLPGGGVFSGLILRDVVLDDGAVAFHTTVPVFGGQESIYTTVEGPLALVANDTVTIPGDTSTFLDVRLPSIDNGKVVFPGGEGTRSDERQGIYAYENGALSVLVDNTGAIPLGFGTASIDDGLVAFDGGPSGFDFGINLRHPDGSIERVFTNLQELPGVGLIRISGPSVLDGGSVAFNGEESSQRTIGVYRAGPGGLEVVANRNTPVPGSTGNFLHTDQPSADNRTVAFIGTTTMPFTNEGVYLWDSSDGSIELIADRNTTVPGVPGLPQRFQHFDDVSVSGDTVAFTAGNGSFGVGLFTSTNGVITKWLTTAEIFDGKIIGSTIELSSEGFDGNQVAVTVNFIDSSRAIYVLTLPIANAPGDANGDGFVTFADFAILQNHFNMPGTFADGDFNGDGFVTFADFAILQNAFDGAGGGAAASLSIAQLAVPEPTTLAWVGIVSVGWMIRRQRAWS